jgi:hypothetical protein
MTADCQGNLKFVKDFSEFGIYLDRTFFANELNQPEYYTWTHLQYAIFFLG